MSFKQKSRDLKKVLLVLMIGHLEMKEKYYLNQFVNILAKSLTKKNKRMKSKLESDVRQIEKKLKLSKPEREIDFKFKANDIQLQFNVKLVKKLENMFSCILRLGHS